MFGKNIKTAYKAPENAPKKMRILLSFIFEIFPVKIKRTKFITKFTVNKTSM